MSIHHGSSSLEALEPRRLLSVDFAWALGGGCSGAAEATALATDTDGSVYVLGRFSGTMDVEPGPGQTFITALGESDLFLIKYSANRKLIWAKSAGGADGRYYPAAISLLPQDRGPVVVGSFTGTVDLSLDRRGSMRTSQGGEDGFIIQPETGAAIGGKYYDAIRTVDARLGYPIVGGVFTQSVSFPQGQTVTTSAGKQDGFVLRYIYDADVNHHFTIGGSGYDAVNQIWVDPGTLQISVVGTMEGTAGFGPSATPDAQGNYPPVHVTSHGGKDAFYALYTSGFQNIFTERYGGAGDDWGDALAVNGTGAYIAGTFSQPMLGLTSKGGSDVFIQRIHSGMIEQIGSTGKDVMGKMAFDANGRLIVTGTYGAPMTFNGTQIANEGNSDVFMAVYNPYLQPNTIVGLGGRYRDTATALATAPGGAVFLAGSFQRWIDLGPGDISAVLYGNATSEFYLDKLIVQ